MKKIFLTAIVFGLTVATPAISLASATGTDATSSSSSTLTVSSTTAVSNTASTTNTGTTTSTTVDCSNFSALKQKVTRDVNYYAGTTTIWNHTGCTQVITLASYNMFDATILHQTLFDYMTVTVKPEEKVLYTVKLPSCAYQMDLGFGPPYQTNPLYGSNFLQGKQILVDKAGNTIPFCSKTTPKLEITKSASSTVLKGQNINYTITVKNSGNATANNVVVTDSIQSNLTYVASSSSAVCSANNSVVTCNISKLNAGETNTIRLVFSVSDSACGRDISNTAKVKADSVSEVTSNTVTTHINCPVPTCTSADYNPERDLVGSFTATSTGKVRNTSTVCSYPIGIASYNMYNSNIDTQVLFDSKIATIGPNSEATLSITVPNCAYQIDLFYGDLITSFAGGKRYATRLLAGEQRVKNNYCGTVVTAPKLEINKVAPVSLVKGSDIDFSFIVKNTGNADARNVVINDIIQSGLSYKVSSSDSLCRVKTSSTSSIECLIGTLRAGSTTEIHVKFSTSQDLACNSKILNRASVLADSLTSVYSNTTETRVTCVEIPPLTAQCSANPTSADIGATINWTAGATGGTGSYTFIWSGTDGLAGSSTSVSKVYATAGAKTATVLVTSGSATTTATCNMNITSGGGGGGCTTNCGGGGGGCTSNCGGSSVASPTLSCKAKSTAAIGEVITFDSITEHTMSPTFSWTGDEGTTGTTSSITKSFNTAGVKKVTVSMNSGVYNLTSVCTVTVGVSTVSMSQASVNRVAGIYLTQVPYTGLKENVLWSLVTIVLLSGITYVAFMFNKKRNSYALETAESTINSLVSFVNVDPNVLLTEELEIHARSNSASLSADVLEAIVKTARGNKDWAKSLITQVISAHIDTNGSSAEGWTLITMSDVKKVYPHI